MCLMERYNDSNEKIILSIYKQSSYCMENSYYSLFTFNISLSYKSLSLIIPAIIKQF